MDAELERHLEGIPFSPSVAGLVEEALKRIACCPICAELFLTPVSLREHLLNRHEDQLIRSGTKLVADHLVEQGDEKIYICPHCHFGVSGGRLDAVSLIITHVERCPQNLSGRSGPSHVSFSFSHDAVLIEAYVHGCVEIELVSCPICGQCFCSSDTVYEHMVLEHSCAHAGTVTDEQLQRIRSAAERFLERKAPHAEGGNAREVLAGAIGAEFSRTVGQAEIDDGILDLPPRLASSLPPVSQVTAHVSGGVESTVLPLTLLEGRRLRGLEEWFKTNAVEPGDIIKLQLLRISPPEIRIWTEWEKRLSSWLSCPPEDLEWQQLTVRDCLIRVLADHDGAIHYRSLYAEISKHRGVQIGSVLATLSRYRGILFAHSGRGTWSWLKDGAETGRHREPQAGKPAIQTRSAGPFSDDIWRILAEIEEGDAVYRLLKRVREPLSFAQICQRISEPLGVDWHELQHTGFLNTEDERITRLDNGCFAIREWFEDSVSETSPAPTPPLDRTEPRILPTTGERLLSNLLALVRRGVERLVRWARRSRHG